MDVCYTPCFTTYTEFNNSKKMNTNDIADYLVQHPHFFEEHAELLAKIKLTSPIMGRSISLQERQMEIVREKLKVLELRLSDLMRVAQEKW